jgi:hypothetical protein
VSVTAAAVKKGACGENNFFFKEGKSSGTLVMMPFVGW